jgi:hypothetical protein
MWLHLGCNGRRSEAAPTLPPILGWSKLADEDTVDDKAKCGYSFAIASFFVFFDFRDLPIFKFLY